MIVRLPNGPIFRISPMLAIPMKMEVRISGAIIIFKHLMKIFPRKLNLSAGFPIKGKFDGEIDAEGHLILGPNAVIKATIRTGVLTNYGKIIGNVEAIEKVELLKGAELNGDVKAPDLIIESGCILNGKCTMGPQVYNAVKSSGAKVGDSSPGE